MLPWGGNKRLLGASHKITWVVLKDDRGVLQDDLGVLQDDLGGITR